MPTLRARCANENARGGRADDELEQPCKSVAVAAFSAWMRDMIARKCWTLSCG
jgi:hypothetical protein